MSSPPPYSLKNGVTTILRFGLKCLSNSHKGNYKKGIVFKWLLLHVHLCELEQFLQYLLQIFCRHQYAQFVQL